MKQLLFIISILVVGCVELTARDVMPLLDNWYFYPSTARTADVAHRVTLPHTWSIEQMGGSVIGNYVRKFDVPSSWRDKRIFVKFYGVNNVANLLVNGAHAGEHRGAYTAFCFEITDFVSCGEENELLLVVNGAQSTQIPPTSLDYSLECGIYRDVELIVTDKAAISPLYYGSHGLFVTTDFVSEHSAKGTVKVILSSHSEEKMDLKLSILDREGNEVFSSLQNSIKPTQDEVVISFDVGDPKGWSPSSPSLYNFRVELTSACSSDMVEVKSGLRVITTDKLGRIYINTERCDVRGVLLYHDHPLVGSVIGESEVASDMALVHEMGATAIRSAVGSHPRALYDYCDSVGLLAWVDFPLSRTSYLADIAYYPTWDYHFNAESISRETVAQNYNHPSIVMWGLFSQLRDAGEQIVSFLTSLRDETKAFDPTRLVVAASNQNGDINALPDLIVWRQNVGWHRGLACDISIWSSTMHDKWNHFKSAVAYGESGSMRHQNLGRDVDFSTRTARATATTLFDRSQPDWHPEAAMTKLHEEYASTLLADSLFWGVWLCNMFDYKSNRDATGENSSGLVSFDRRERKDIFHLYKSQWNSSQPTLHIAGRREWRRGANVTDLRLYSSEESPIEIILNGVDTLPSIPIGAGIHSVETFELSRGKNIIEARQGELSDRVEFIY